MKIILVKELRGGHYDGFAEDGTVTQTMTQEAGGVKIRHDTRVER